MSCTAVQIQNHSEMRGYPTTSFQLSKINIMCPLVAFDLILIYKFIGVIPFKQISTILGVFFYFELSFWMANHTLKYLDIHEQTLN